MQIDSTGEKYSLSADELEFFNENGYIYPITIYEPAEFDEKWRQARIDLLDRSKAVYPEDSIDENFGVTNIANYDRHLDNEFLARHVTNPKIVDRVVSIIGNDVLCWRTEFFPKQAGDEGTDWHQADTFANASGEPQILWPSGDESVVRGGTVTVWTAFTDTTIETACLQFIPGTHKYMHYDESKPMRYQPELFNRAEKSGVRRGFYGYDYRELQIDPNFVPDESRAVSIELTRGQCVIFLSTLMHASHPNKAKKGSQSRLGMAARYVPTRVRVYPDVNEIEEYGGRVSLDNYGAVLVSGDDHYGFNKIVTETTRGFKYPRRP